MDKEKETKKLGAEELEKRVAPMAITVRGDEPVDSDPTIAPDQTPTTSPEGSPDRTGIVDRIR